jgi:hypothetical protein
LRGNSFLIGGEEFWPVGGELVEEVGEGGAFGAFAGVVDGVVGGPGVGGLVLGVGGFEDGVDVAVVGVHEESGGGGGDAGVLIGEESEGDEGEGCEFGFDVEGGVEGVDEEEGSVCTIQR